MVDRTMILLLLVLGTYVWYVRPVTDEVPLVKHQVQQLQRQIAYEQALVSATVDIEEHLNRTLKYSQDNRQLMWPATISSSQAFGQLEQLVRTLAAGQGLSFVQGNWGEAVTSDLLAYVRLPMAVILTGQPPQIAAFLHDLAQAERLVRVETAQLNKAQRSGLSLQLNLVGYQLVAAKAGGS